MIRFKVRISGANDVIAALVRLPRDATDALQDQARDIAETLADRIFYAARRSDAQSAKVAPTVKATKSGVWPAITAGGGRWGRALLLGSNFGMTKHSGWYARARFYDSRGRQFREHIGSGRAAGDDYWFFITAERNQPWVESEWREAADEVLRRWDA